MRDSSRNVWLPLAVCVLAFGVRIGMWLWDGSALHQDLDAYLEIARHVAQGEGYSRGTPPRPTAFRSPLYPLLIAGLLRAGATPWLLGGVQVLLGTLTTVLTLRCGRLLNLGFGSLIAAGFVALDPLLVRYTTLPMTETLCAALVILWCWVMLEFPARHDAASTVSKFMSVKHTTLRAFLHGACFGMVCLCRPAFLAAAGLIVVWIVMTAASGWYSKTSAKDGTTDRALAGRWNGFGPLLASLIGFVIVLAPWIVRNAIVIGKPTAATTHGGYTVLLANNPVFYREVLDGPRGAVWQEASLLAWQQSLEDDMARDGIAATDEVSRDRWMYRRAWSAISAEPITFLRACVYRLRCFWSLAPSRKANDLGLMVSWAITMFYGIVSIGLIIGLFRLTAAEWIRWSPLLLLPVTLCLTHLVYWTDTRMRAPVVPVLALLATRGFISIKASGGCQPPDHSAKSSVYG